jgi:S1-C subfamily serine protease
MLYRAILLSLLLFLSGCTAIGSIRDYRAAYGTGFIVNSDGVIVTAYHVIDSNVENITVVYNHRRYIAKVIAYDIPSDVAIIKIQERNTSYLTIAGATGTGADLVMIGFPLVNRLYASPTTTYGKVINPSNSSIWDSEFPVVQTNLNMCYGNSGGPVLSGDSVVGISEGIIIYKIGATCSTTSVLVRSQEILHLLRLSSITLGTGKSDLRAVVQIVSNLPSWGT